MTNKEAAAEAKALTPYARRVLLALSRVESVATPEHVVDLLHWSNMVDFPDARTRKPQWPGPQLNMLERMGHIEAYFAVAGEFSTRLYRITADGKRVANWCFSDGSVANA